MESNSLQTKRSQRPVKFPEGKISDVTARKVFSKLGEMTKEELGKLKEEIESEKYVGEAWTEALRKGCEKIIKEKKWKYDDVSPKKIAEISKDVEKDARELSEEKKKQKLTRQALLASRISKINKILQDPSKVNKITEESKLPRIKAAVAKEEIMAEKPTKLKTEPVAVDKRGGFLNVLKNTFENNKTKEKPRFSTVTKKEPLSLANRIMRHLFNR